MDFSSMWIDNRLVVVARLVLRRPEQNDTIKDYG